LNILAMKSLSRRAEQVWKSGGIPWRALGGSLLLHWLVLAALLPLGAPAPAPAERTSTAPLAALLRPADGAVEAASAVPPAPTLPARHPRTVAPAVLTAPTRTEAALPQPVATAPSEAAPVPQEGVASRGTTLVAAPRAAGGATRSAATLAGPTNAALPAASSEAAAPDAAGLRQFRVALAEEARRFRNYPEAARRAGLAGIAEISVAVTPAARQAALARSSGHAALDAAALEMLQAAVARAPLPDTLRGRSFAVRLPVVFAVED